MYRVEKCCEERESGLHENQLKVVGFEPMTLALAVPGAFHLASELDVAQLHLKLPWVQLIVYWSSLYN